MPSINRALYDQANPSMVVAELRQMPPGVYLLYIQAVRLEWDTMNGHTDGLAKQCARIVWDVADGRFKKRYCDPYYADGSGKPLQDRDFAHSCYISWRENNLGYLKHKLNVLDACNPGFNSLEALENDRWDDFVGRKFYAVINVEIDFNSRGYVRHKPSVGAWLTPDQVRSGDHPDPVTKDLRDDQAYGGVRITGDGA